MNLNIKSTHFYKVSELEPEEIRKFMCCEVGEKAQQKLYNDLCDLADSYPDFENWFYQKVLPELNLRNGSREIIVAISTVDNIEKVMLTGIAILKKTQIEKKICTFRIHEKYRGLGIGSNLFKECFSFLETSTPIITISENRIPMFKKHIEQFKFKEYEVLGNFYTNGSNEHVFNGYLSK